jgi:hypothetical protein
MIKQRNMTDCGICCLAMALNVSYEDILALVPAYSARLTWGDKGGLYKSEIREVARAYSQGVRTTFKYYMEDNGGDFWRDMKGDRAILSVPSLNVEDGLHLVYWDGKAIVDPSNLKTYTKEMIPRSAYAMILVPAAAA